MKNLYLILRVNSNPTTLKLLSDAAKNKNINLHLIYSDSFDFSEEINLTKDDGLYNLSDDLSSQLVEKKLLNPQVKTFYKDYRIGINKFGDADDLRSYLIFRQNNLPAIPSIISLTTDKTLLEKYSTSLGGFPIILKISGKSHGEGVIKIEDINQLISEYENIKDTDNSIILRQYIPHAHQARIIVLGNEAIASHTNIATSDFRTNAGENQDRKREVINYDLEIYDMAAKAINSLGYEFGAVDILFDKSNNKPFIAEVNLPCFFPRTQELTGINIAERMIDFLINK